MRPYIIINGVNSESIKGLLITSLPPIVKSKKRTEITEIDGRDGDIVTDLGYSAYDRELGVGLYGQCDVNDVIQFLDTKGRIIFSNEPDKYYNFEIFGEVAFAKLVRYKTAVVPVHVQPFKYSALETKKTEIMEEGATTGSITVRNRGNIVSRPALTLTGTGILTVLINGNQVFQADLSNNHTITIDSALMEAYNGNTLLNRVVVGDYDNLVLPSGVNVITVNGAVTSIAIENYSRWD